MTHKSSHFKKIIPKDDNFLRETCTQCHRIFYENPKLVVGTMPFYKGKLLLCQRAIEPAKGLWTVPAGFMEVGESLEEGAARETFEEAGVHVTLKQLFGLYSIPRIAQVYALFLASIDTFKLNPGPETLKAELFSLEDIPFEKLAFGAVRFMIRSYITAMLKSNQQKIPLAPVLATYSKEH